MKFKILFIFSWFLFLSVATAQDKTVETKFFVNNPDLGGDVVINSSTREVVDGKSYTTFELEAPSGGSYALGLWVLPAEYPNGKYSSYGVIVNGVKISETVEFTKGNWQALTLKGKVSLKRGTNVISFTAGLEEYPAVEYVRLSTDADKAQISSAFYDNYLAEVTAKSLKAIDSGDTLRSVSRDAFQVTPPGGNYQYETCSFAYTWYSLRSFTAGQSVTVSASVTSGNTVSIEDRRFPSCCLSNRTAGANRDIQGGKFGADKLPLLTWHRPAFLSCTRLSM